MNIRVRFAKESVYFKFTLMYALKLIHILEVGCSLILIIHLGYVWHFESVVRIQNISFKRLPAVEIQ
jgi:hypothetical protein